MKVQRLILLMRHILFKLVLKREIRYLFANNICKFCEDLL
jgi:hypothetical protein